MKKYRIIFSDGPMGNKSVHRDVATKDSDDAFRIAFRLPEAEQFRGHDVMVEEIVEGPQNIGVLFEYEDTVFKRTFKDNVIIRAESEKQAVSWYNQNLKGKRFWFTAGEVKEDGKCVYGRAVDTYFAACPGYHADATQ